MKTLGILSDTLEQKAFNKGEDIFVLTEEVSKDMKNSVTSELFKYIGRKTWNIL